MIEKIAIEFKNVNKSFKFWDERPTSLKTVLVNLISGKFRIGKRREISVLQNISFKIINGEFVAIMGRNGAGKSTILKLISKIYYPNSGIIKVNGQIAPMIELGAGFIPDLSGYENIFLNAAILGYGRKQMLEKLNEIIKFAEIGDLINMPIKNYSSGMLVRLGFSIATHIDAPIILIDEVLSVGDVSFQAKCLKKIEELHQGGRTIVLITHNPDQVLKHASRCIVIDHSKIIFDGSPEIGVGYYLTEKNTI